MRNDFQRGIGLKPASEAKRESGDHSGPYDLHHRSWDSKLSMRSPGSLFAFAQAHLAPIGVAIVTAIVVLFAGHLLWTNEKRVVQTKLLPPDTPPAEYLYLDSDRALAYLGQIEGGLTANEKRTESETESQQATLKGGLLAEINGQIQRQASIEATVTPAATDRFFTLLIKLRSGREQRGRHEFGWLRTIDARLDHANDAEKLRRQLLDLHEGDFVRIENAHLFLPGYASITPRARYAASYLRGDITQPRQPLYAPVSANAQRAIKRYLTALGADPTLPFVVPTLTSGRTANTPIIFFVPTRYSDLLDNPRLLASNLTVVGKVTYLDPRRPNDQRCASVPCTYVDRETLSVFAPALKKAPKAVLQGLGIDRAQALGLVKTSVTFHAPVAVVLPVAIYQ